MCGTLCLRYRYLVTFAALFTCDKICSVVALNGKSILGWRISSNDCGGGGRGRKYTGSGPLWRRGRGRRLQQRGPCCCKRCRSHIQVGDNSASVAVVGRVLILNAVRPNQICNCRDTYTYIVEKSCARRSQIYITCSSSGPCFVRLSVAYIQ